MRHPFDGILESTSESPRSGRRTFLRGMVASLAGVLGAAAAAQACQTQPQPSTAALREEGGDHATTLREGEEGGIQPLPDDGITTQRVGEEGASTARVGEEG